MSNKDEMILLIEHWKQIVSEEDLVFEDVLNMMLEEEVLNESLGLKTKIIAPILASLFVLSPNVSNANPASFSKFTSGVSKMCDGGGSGQCSINIAPRTSLSKIQQGIITLGIDLDIADMDGLKEADAIKIIKDKISNNKQVVIQALKSEDSKMMAGIEEGTNLEDMSLQQLYKTYNNAPGGEMFMPVLNLIM